jgi:hypothetical protein
VLLTHAHCPPSPNAVAELALLGSIAGRSPESLLSRPLGPVLRRFWLASRSLQQGWMRDLSRFRAATIGQGDGFEKIALEVFLGELLTRVWATNWTIVDRAQGRCDAERILINSLHGLRRVHREILLMMVHSWQRESSETISRVDRFRRRSERWTDLLIAGPASLHGVWEFAVEAHRAQDFAAGPWSETAGAANPASLLVSAGLRVMFGTPWPAGCCRQSPFADLLSAVLSTLPGTAFHDDGTLKPVHEWTNART